MLAADTQKKTRRGWWGGGGGGGATGTYVDILDIILSVGDGGLGGVAKGKFSVT